MNKKIIFMLIIFIAGCSKNIRIDNLDASPSDNYEELYEYQNTEKRISQVFEDQSVPFDVRSTDIRDKSLIDISSNRLNNDILFDTRTKWPMDMPNDFYPDKLMESGKDKRPYIEELNRQGVTGKGINIALIDQPLLLNHVEYKENIKFYYSLSNQKVASFHGGYVTSILAGTNMGVAPDVGIYYVACDGVKENTEGKILLDFAEKAKAVRIIIEVNEKLPESDKIKIISLSAGFTDNAVGVDDFLDAVDEAEQAGIPVLYCDQKNYVGEFFLMKKLPYQNAQDNLSYVFDEIHVSDRIREDVEKTPKFLVIPSGGLTFASPTGVNDYVYGANNGISEIPPYLAGLYALACQVNKDIKFSEFMDCLYKTSDCEVRVSEEIEKNIETKKVRNIIVERGVIVNPKSAIESFE